MQVECNSSIPPPPPSSHTHTQVFSRPLSEMSRRGHPPPSLFITGRPVVIFDDSLLAMVLGRGPYRPRPPESLSMAHHILDFGAPQRCIHDVSVPELGQYSGSPSLALSTPPPAPSSLDQSLVLYSSSREHSLRMRGFLEPPRPTVSPLRQAEDTSQTSVGYAAMVPSPPNTLPEGICVVPESPPFKPVPEHSCDGFEAEWSPPPESGQIRDPVTSLASVPATDEGAPEPKQAIPLKDKETSIVSQEYVHSPSPPTPPEANYPGSPSPEMSVPNPDSPSPPVAIGEKILCTMAEGIAAIGRKDRSNRSLEELDEPATFLPVGKPDHHGDIRQSLRAAVSAFVCGEREELCADSDTEIEEAETVEDGSSSPKKPPRDKDDHTAAGSSPSPLADTHNPSPLLHPPSTPQPLIPEALTSIVTGDGVADTLPDIEPPCKRQKIEANPAAVREFLPSHENEVYEPSTMSGERCCDTARLLNSSMLEYPREVCEDADDGSATVDQALPSEGARQHAMVPNVVSCKEEEEEEGEDGGSDGEGGIDTGDNPLEKSPPSDGKHCTATQVPDWKLESACHSKDGSVQLPPPVYAEQQVVPESYLENTILPQTLYEEEGTKISPCVPSLEEVDIDDLDGPTVLSMAMASIDGRRRKSPEMEVRPTGKPHWEQLYSTPATVGGYRVTPQLQAGSQLMATTRLNLSRPRLRLGLSKRFKHTPLHHTN